MKALTTSFYHNRNQIALYLFFYRLKFIYQNSQESIVFKVQYCQRKVKRTNFHNEIVKYTLKILKTLNLLDILSISSRLERINGFNRKNWAGQYNNSFKIDTRATRRSNNVEIKLRTCTLKALQILHAPNESVNLFERIGPDNTITCWRLIHVLREALNSL